MRYGFDYVVEKLMAAFYALATGAGAVQDRLGSAHSAFHLISAENFPEGELREAWESIDARLKAHDEPPPHRIGSVRYTLGRMSDDDAVMVATAIMNLYLDAWRELEQRPVRRAP